MNPFKNFLYIIPIILYYFVESIFLAIIIYPTWKFVLCEKFNGIMFSYRDWVFIIWIIKILLFDVFKVSPFFTIAPDEDKDKNNEN